MRDMRKRGRGEGTIRRRPGRSLWEARYYDGDGQQHSVYASTRREVQVKLDASRRAVTEGAFVTGAPQTVAQYLNHWLDAVASQRLRPRTLERYQGVVRKHIIPALGDIRLSKVTPQHIERLYSSKRRDLSPAGIRYIHQVLHTALAHGLRMHAVVGNAAAGVAPPKPAHREMLYLTPDEARRFLAAIQGDPLEPLYTLALTTGMRLGELLGLRWQAVEGADLQVRITLTRTAGGWSLTEPKTPKSRRRIALSTTAITALRRERARQAEARLRAGEAWTDHGLVFTDAFGEPLFGSRITERRLRPALKKAGLPLIRFHDLRHTAATLMLTAGVHPKVVSEMLGHSTVAITLDRYSHLIPTMQEEAALQMDRLLSDPVRVQTRVRRIPRTRKSPDSSVNRGSEMKVGTAYRIRTGDLRLERAVS
jgi:integrase